jgi:hypothetical protein
MLNIWRVSGDSLEPQYQNGDFVVISKVPILLRRLRPGDAVVLRHPRYGPLIKLVERLEARQEQIYVVGLKENSVDSRLFGPLSRRDLAGKVILHIRKP